MKIENKRYLYYAAIFLFVAIVFGIYFCMFHGDLSDDSYIWSNFGNYINGFLTPLLTIINIVVFIELTIAISNIEEHRSEKALENEKQLLLMQLKKQELDTFIRQMIKIDDYNTREEGIKAIRPVTYYLQAFEKTGLKYFDLKENHEHVAQLLRSFSFRLNQYVNMLEENKDFDEELFHKIYNTKEELMKILVDSTLNDNN